MNYSQKKSSIFLFFLLISAIFFSQERKWRGYYDVKGTNQRGFDVTLNYTIKLSRASLNNDVYIKMNFLPERKNSTQAYRFNGKVHDLNNMGAYGKRITLSNIKFATATVLVRVGAQTKKMDIRYIPLKNKFSSGIFVLDKFNLDEETKTKYRNNLNNISVEVLRMNVDTTDRDIEQGIMEYEEKRKADKEIDKIKYMPEETVDDINAKFIAYNKLSKYGEFKEEKQELREKIATINKIKSLKAKIASLGSSKEDLEKKLNYYRELEKLDRTQYYTNEIRNVNYDLQKIENERLSQVKNDAIKMREEKDKEKREIAKIEKEARDKKYEYDKKQREIKAKKDADYYEGRRRTKEILKKAQERKTYQAISNAASTATNAIVGGVSDGVITGLELLYNSRAYEGESNELSSIINNETYQLGLVMFDQQAAILNFGYGDPSTYQDNAEGSIFTFGLDVNVLNILATPHAMKDNSYFLKVSLGGEYGFGTADYSDEFRGQVEFFEDEASFYGFHVGVKMVEYLSFGYGIGWYSGSSNGEDFSGEYNRWFAGIRIPF